MKNKIGWLAFFAVSLSVLVGFVPEKATLEQYPANCLDSLNIPNAFTPNNDGQNDVFFVNFPCPPQKFEISIFNRWGESLYVTDAYDFKWRGNDANGRPLPGGVYAWIMTYKFNNKDESVNGNIVLMR